MPEYLAPGVYVEETTYRARSIEGVATSTTGFVGMARWGPTIEAAETSPSATEPRLITSFTEFQRVYGGFEPLVFAGAERTNYLAHAARTYFLNGGKRLYVARVCSGASRAEIATPADPTTRWVARWPGVYGNMLVRVRAVRRGAVGYDNADFGSWQANGLTAGAVVEVTPAGPPGDGDPIDPTALHTLVDADPLVTDSMGRIQQELVPSGGGPSVPLPANAGINEIVLEVTVIAADGRTDTYGELVTHSDKPRFVGTVLGAVDPQDDDALVYLDTPDTAAPEGAAQLLLALAEGATEMVTELRLVGGADGVEVAATGGTAATLEGRPSDPDDPAIKATGLAALAEVEDIAIVAAPDGGALGGDGPTQAAEALIAHAELTRYRIAVVDGPVGSSINDIRTFRGRFDTTRAALYHPWVEVIDPLRPAQQGAPARRLLLPPSGFVTGIYARNDVERGVWKAPANEVVRGLTRFESTINTGRNEVLNPEGINALRFFEGRGNRVWGARTMSSDPEWRYVNVRRLFLYLERSIDLAMQFAVFEPNNERLWSNIRQAVEDFLYVQWLDGALLGATPTEAYFVRCDRTTMTQNDLDNGRLICLIGVAPTKPAEFVIFRIGQWTADANS